MQINNLFTFICTHMVKGKYNQTTSCVEYLLLLSSFFYFIYWEQKWPVKMFRNTTGFSYATRTRPYEIRFVRFSWSQNFNEHFSHTFDGHLATTWKLQNHLKKWMYVILVVLLTQLMRNGCKGLNTLLSWCPE